MTTIEVTRTYLEMRDHSDLQPAHSDDPRMQIEQLPDCSPSFYRHLYVEVGKNYHWIDRLPWIDKEIVAYLNRQEIYLWLVTCDDARAGHFDLRRREDRSTELA